MPRSPSVVWGDSLPNLGPCGSLPQALYRYNVLPPMPYQQIQLTVFTSNCYIPNLTYAYGLSSPVLRAVSLALPHSHTLPPCGFLLYHLLSVTVPGCSTSYVPNGPPQCRWCTYQVQIGCTPPICIWRWRPSNKSNGWRLYTNRMSRSWR